VVGLILSAIYVTMGKIYIIQEGCVAKMMAIFAQNVFKLVGVKGNKMKSAKWAKRRLNKRMKKWVKETKRNMIKFAICSEYIYVRGNK
jgi:hypothetical protein